jgi:hypothetical protein
MLLKFCKQPGEFCADTVTLSPHHPVLEMTETEAAGANEVLHVQVTCDNGEKAHIHFAVGVKADGQLVGEVTAMRGSEPARRCSRVAKWRPADERS